MLHNTKQVNESVSDFTAARGCGALAKNEEGRKYRVRKVRRGQQGLPQADMTLYIYTVKL